MRAYATIALLAYCADVAGADNPPPAVAREPIAFKDLTPPALPEAGGTHTTCGPECSPGPDGGLFGGVEYLLYRPRRGAFDFAISDPNRDLVPSGTLLALNYEQRSGVRAAIGYRCPGTWWDVAFEYTYFRTSASRFATVPPGGTLYATLTRAGLNDEAAVANADASFEYNVFDAVLGRRFVLDEMSSFRFFGGMRFASISQDFNAAYDGRQANFGQVATSNNFDGFGPIIGGDITVNLRGGFHVYARGSAVLMTGSLRTPFTETNNAGQTLYANLDISGHRVIPVTGLGIGGGWQRNNVAIRAGYEITNWYGLIDSPRFTGELSEGKITFRSGNLSLEGLFAQIAVSY